MTAAGRILRGAPTILIGGGGARGLNQRGEGGLEGFLGLHH